MQCRSAWKIVVLIRCIPSVHYSVHLIVRLIVQVRTHAGQRTVRLPARVKLLQYV